MFLLRFCLKAEEKKEGRKFLILRNARGKLIAHKRMSKLLTYCIKSLLCNSTGIPLEMGQPGRKGSLRVAGLFMAGIFVGGLGAGIAESEKYLVGSSPGTYALIMAHLGTYGKPG